MLLCYECGIGEVRISKGRRAPAILSGPSHSLRSHVLPFSARKGSGGDAMESVVGRELLSQRVQAIKPSGIRKFFDIAATMDDVISLGVGEPDFVTPNHIRQAGIRAIRSGETHYTSNYGTIELREAIADHLERHNGVRYDPQHEILVTVGVSEAVDITMRALLDPGDEVVIPDPGYVAYEADVTLAGGTVVPVRTH